MDSGRGGGIRRGADARARTDARSCLSRFIPAAGVTFSPNHSVNVYGGYSEESRAATSIELGCADPNEPCKLPNAMTGDPPLNQVVTRTWEAGARGEHHHVSWSASIFRADSHDDILFVTSGQTGFGYFRNFGKTRRQGFELGVDGRPHRIRIGAGYTFLAATYETEETVNGASNSSNDAEAPGLEGSITILPGDRIPLMPRHMFKTYADSRSHRETISRRRRGIPAAAQHVLRSWRAAADVDWNALQVLTLSGEKPRIQGAHRLDVDAR